MDINNDQTSFNKWLASHRSGQTSQQTDLPSSQLPSKASLIISDVPQLFVIMDTCSIVSYRIEFMDHITRLNDLFRGQICPVRFIISLPVLEELDKFNRRPAKKRRNGPVKEEPVAAAAAATSSDNNNNSGIEDPDDPLLSRLLAMARQGKQTTEQNQSSKMSSNQLQGPPRMFARFIEEEMRMGERLIGELDPHKEIPLRSREVNFEIVNHDDRILDCCMRTRAFVRSKPHHPDSVIILVSEDNVFKSKATTFDIPSYRWREFSLKYKNFGLKNYVSTPTSLPSTGNIKSYSSNNRSSNRPNPFLLLKREPAIQENSTSMKSEDGVIFVEEVINIE